jgi:hypothetical protein
LTVSASLAQRFGASATVVNERRERIEAYQWALAKRQPRGLRSDELADDAPRAIAYFDHLQSRGEVEEARTILNEMHVTEAQASARYKKERAEAQQPPIIPGGGGLKLPSQ